MDCVISKEGLLEMETIYRVIGVKLHGDYVKLLLSPNIIQEEITVTKAFVNLNSFFDKIKTDASDKPDIIRIPYDEYQRNQYTLNDIIQVVVKPKIGGE